MKQAIATASARRYAFSLGLVPGIDAFCKTADQILASIARYAQRTTASNL